MHYIFDLRCPRCYSQHQVIGTKQDLPPRLNCGGCLITRAEVIEFEIVNVTVLSGNEGVDLFHHVNDSKEQRP
jgi:hypothetical protein